MSSYTAPLKDLRFVLNELAGLGEVAKLPGCEEATPDTVDAILEEASKFASEVLDPINYSGDREGSVWKDGDVRTPKGFKQAYQQYVAGGWNALHRDLYGALVFPLQVVINLSEPGVDHTGGEFLLVEQRPRAQSRGTATLLPHGHGYLFTNRDRPVRSARGWSAAPVRHGVSAIRSGQRFTLGLVFHDAA